MELGIIGTILAIMVITERNPVRGVMQMIGVFVMIAMMLLEEGVEYMGIMIIIVYVGAIAVIFVFIVMMIAARKESRGAIKRIGIGIAVGGIVWMGIEEIGIEMIREEYKIEEIPMRIGQIMYTECRKEVVVAGIILIVGLIGGIRLVR